MPDDVPRRVRRLALTVAIALSADSVLLPGARAQRGAALLHIHYFVAPRLCCPAVVTVHDLTLPRARSSSRGGTARCSGRARLGAPGRRVIAVSEFTRADLIDRYGLDPAKVVTIPNGVDAMLPADGRRPRRVREASASIVPFVLFVGALQPRKNVPLARGVSTGWTGTDVELRSSRRRRPRRSRTRCARRDPAHSADRPRAIPRPRVEDEELPRSTAPRELLVFPSLYEGFGLPALEAMASGTPVVASSHDGRSAEVVGDAGLTFDPTSPEELAERSGCSTTGPARAACALPASRARRTSPGGGRPTRRRGSIARRWNDDARGRRLVVSHDQRALLEACLEALRVDDVPVVLLENMPDGSAALAVSLGARADVFAHPASFARNQNALIGRRGRATS